MSTEQVNNLLNEIDANQATIDTNIKKKLLSLQNNNAVFTEALLKKIRNIVELIKQLKPKFAENAEKLQQKQAELNKCQEDINNYKAQFEQLNEQQSKQNEQISQKQIELDSLNSKIAELNEEIERLNQALQEAQSNADQSNDDDEELANAMAEEQQKLADARQQNDVNNPSNPTELYNQLQARKEELRNMELERNKLSRDLSIAQESITKLMTALTKINQKLLEHIQIISQIVSDIPTMAPYEEDLTAIEQELQQLLSTNTVGGKRRRRKTKKMRGGYLYSRKSNSNSSSMNRLSGSNSKSKTKTKSKSKTKSKKNIF
jgi:chromosome segregation ATPase